MKFVRGLKRIQERTGWCVAFSKNAETLGPCKSISMHLKKAAKELGATVKTSELVLPDGQVPDIETDGGGCQCGLYHELGDYAPAQSGRGRAECCPWSKNNRSHGLENPRKRKTIILRQPYPDLAENPQFGFS